MILSRAANSRALNDRALNNHVLNRCAPGRIALFVSATTLVLAACAPMPVVREPAPSPTPMAKSAVANLAAASGSLVSGRLMLMPMAMNGMDGVHITGEVGGLPPNSTHGIHVHQTGDCSAADASSAGDHFNPTNSAHGKSGPGAHHGGDMDNISANAGGVARVDFHLHGVALGTGMANDIGNRAVVVHTAPDDYRSQPSGNSGARVACGVIAVTR